MQRQSELASWSILMLRLQLIADIALAAPPDDGVSALAELDERAAEAAAGNKGARTDRPPAAGSMSRPAGKLAQLPSARFHR